ncbi:MAG: gamma carbonic anhydrase family protein [Burkholderiales bacterium]|nr:MAG: gamma carbonic anhydrase family protein [Burkholderiales bacterium]
MPTYRLGEDAPDLAPDAWVAPGAHVIGRVRLAAQASVWFGAVLRGDNEPIAIGARSNVQDGAVLHTDPGFPLQIEDNVTVGHLAMLHGCTIGAGTLIGVQAVVMNGAVVGRECLVGAGALITEGKTFPDRSLIIGAPAKAVRTLSDEELASLHRAADVDAKRSARYRAELVPIG